MHFKFGNSNARVKFLNKGCYNTIALNSQLPDFTLDITIAIEQYNSHQNNKNERAK
jgi:hypothetical protein